MAIPGLEAIIERVKTDYKFNMPDYKVDEKFFQKVEDPVAVQRLLFDSLCKAKVVGEALDNIELSFYEKQEYRPILLRSCYFDLFELILDSLRIPQDNHRHLILGSPGIGKSWFHVFCLFVLMKAEIPVYIQRKGYSALFFKGEAYEAYDCNNLVRNNLLSRSNIWHLYDRTEPPKGLSSENITVMVSSPGRETYKDYVKCCHFGRMYMPLWNYKELELINRLRTPSTSRLSEERLRERFQLCGGIARHIFDDYKDYKKEYARAVSDYSISELHPNPLRDDDERGHLIYGLKVT